jgi:predicted permease
MWWIGRLFRRRGLERELDDELRFHLEQHTRDLIAAGVDPDAARREARLALGGLEQVKEAARDVRGTRWLEDWWHDTRLALRGMRRAPGFAAAALLTLALGIGANTAVYSLVRALLLEPLPVVRPNELSVLERVGLGDDHFQFSHPWYDRLRAVTPDSAGLAAMSAAVRGYATIAEEPEQVMLQLVSGNWFSLLGVGVVAGRPFGPDDDRTIGGHPVAVISHGYWTRRFGADPRVIGRTLRINGMPLTVVGVIEPGFFGFSVGEAVEVWIPLMMQEQVRYHVNANTTDGDTSKPWVPQTGVSWLTLIHRAPPAERAAQAGRLGVQFAAELANSITTADSATRRYQLRERIQLLPTPRGISRLRQAFATPLVALTVSVGLVLLVACANLAGLLLARSAARSHEIAVRVSLGARPGRLVRQTLTESLTLAILGGVASLAIARAGGPALLRAASSGPTVIPLDLPLDGRLLLFALGVSVLAGLLFGLAPAVRVAGGDLYQTFKTGGRVVGSREPHRLPLGRVLVVSQIALSLVLVTAAGLFVRTLRNLLAVDAGFARSSVIAIRFDPRAAGYQEAQLPALWERVLAAVRGVPGVRSASLSLHTLATGSMRTSSFVVTGRTDPPEWDGNAQEDFVTPDFFETIGLPILRGRAFGPGDVAGAPGVAIVSETAARHFFGSDDPIGRRIGYDQTESVEIVGVVRDARLNAIRQAPPRIVFRPAAQLPAEYLQGIEARVAGDPVRAIPAIQTTLAAVDRNLPIREIATFDDLLRRGLRSERFVSELVGLFGGLALVLAAIGLYGVMAYSVARRTNEMGVRLALGAAPAKVRWLVLRDSLAMVSLGLVLGTLILIPLLGLARDLVYGFSPRDPVTPLVAASVLLAAGLVAGTVPAWRASRVDPATALRAE